MSRSLASHDFEPVDAGDYAEISTVRSRSNDINDPNRVWKKRESESLLKGFLRKCQLCLFLGVQEFVKFEAFLRIKNPLKKLHMFIVKSVGTN